MFFSGLICCVCLLAMFPTSSPMSSSLGRIPGAGQQHQQLRRPVAQPLLRIDRRLGKGNGGIRPGMPVRPVQPMWPINSYQFMNPPKPDPTPSAVQKPKQPLFLRPKTLEWAGQKAYNVVIDEDYVYTHTPFDWEAAAKNNNNNSSGNNVAQNSTTSSAIAVAFNQLISDLFDHVMFTFILPIYIYQYFNKKDEILSLSSFSSKPNKN